MNIFLPLWLIILPVAVVLAVLAFIGLLTIILLWTLRDMELPHF